jgi:hypothetical protein
MEEVSDSLDFIGIPTQLPCIIDHIDEDGMVLSVVNNVDVEPLILVFELDDTDVMIERLEYKEGDKCIVTYTPMYDDANKEVYNEITFTVI